MIHLTHISPLLRPLTYRLLHSRGIYLCQFIFHIHVSMRARAQYFARGWFSIPFLVKIGVYYAKCELEWFQHIEQHALNAATILFIIF